MGIAMKAAFYLAALAASTSALSIPSGVRQGIQQLASGQNPLATAEKYLIELAPGEQRWVTDEEKWELRRQGQNFFDITDTPELSLSQHEQSTVKFPKKTAYNESVSPLLKELDKKQMKKHLETFTGFHTRYYKSDYGAQSSAWLLDQVNQTLTDAGVGLVRHFEHPWGQNSIIATLPGKSEKTVVIGAHQDSINLFLPSLLASQAIFQSYKNEGRDVKAMLQQDMTGYTHATLEAGEPESVGVITDYVDPGLTQFIKEVVSTYCAIPFVSTSCGYACSDHASASKAGYPSAFVIESDFKYSDNKIHTTEDKIEYLSFDHMLQHAKLTLGLAFEL